MLNFVGIMKKALLLFSLVFALAMTPESPAMAQCSMCTINAEQGTQNGNTQGKGLNDGVLYLLALPYLLIAGVGIIWYRSYKKKLDSQSVSRL
jgi:hypothetical protein